MVSAKPNRYYVYEHIRPDTGKVFYVGKGCGNRAFSPHGRNPHHANIVAKLIRVGLKLEIRFVMRDMYEEDAFILERIRIDHHRHMDTELTNLTDGGEGASGYEYSSEQREAMSLKRKGKRKSKEHIEKVAEWHRGKKKSKSTCEKISEKAKGRTPDPSAAEKRWASIRENGKGEKIARVLLENSRKASKGVICINNQKIYQSLSEAARETGRPASNIRCVCEGTRRHTGGLVFNYWNES